MCACRFGLPTARSSSKSYARCRPQYFVSRTHWCLGYRSSGQPQRFRSSILGDWFAHSCDVVFCDSGVCGYSEELEGAPKKRVGRSPKKKELEGAQKKRVGRRRGAKAPSTVVAIGLDAALTAPSTSGHWSPRPAHRLTMLLGPSPSLLLRSQ